MKPSVLLSSLSWASLFSLIWMILLKYVKPEPSAIYTVQEAYQHPPHPGYVGWMSDPIFREDYIKKYLPNVAVPAE